MSGVLLASLPNGTLFSSVQVEARGQLFTAAIPAAGASVQAFTHVPGEQAGQPGYTGSAVEVFADEALTTPLQQPLTVDAEGRVPGWLASGQTLDLLASGGPFSSPQVFVVGVTDPTASSGGLATFAQTVGDGTSTTFTVTHNLGSSDVTVTVIDLTDNQIIYPTVTVISTNAVTVRFSVAPAANETRVLVVKA